MCCTAAIDVAAVSNAHNADAAACCMLRVFVARVPHTKLLLFLFFRLLILIST